MGGAAPPCHAAPSAGGMAEATESASQRLEEDAGVEHRRDEPARVSSSGGRARAESGRSTVLMRSRCEASAEAVTRERKTETEEPRARRPSA